MTHPSLMWMMCKCGIHIVSVDCVTTMWSWEFHDVDGKLLMMRLRGL